jgi:hypothetical protein
MHVARSSSRRAGVVSALVIAGGLAFVGAVGVYSMASANPANPTNTGAGAGAGAAASGAKPKKPAQPQEIGAVVILAGIDAGSLAAAGFSGSGCDTVFENADVYCLQSDRITDFALAHKALNEAKARAVKPPVQGQGELPTVAQAQGALNDLRENAFTALTAGLDTDKVAKLRKIRANKQTWHISEPYLTVDGTDEQWLALRGALAAQRFAARKGIELDAGPAAVIAAADADQNVSAAKTDYASNLPSVNQAWSTHTH